MEQETIGHLKTLLDYDPTTGIFVWRHRPNDSRTNRIFNTRYAGKVAGKIRKKDGYVRIKDYLAHRLAFMFINGPIPPGMLIDHKDRVPSNNRIVNLRLATKYQNGYNSRSYGSSGIKNVYRHGSSWFVEIIANGKKHYFGIYPTIEAAAIVADRERNRLHGEFARAS